MQILIQCYRILNYSVDYVIMILSFPSIRLVNTLQPYLEKLLCWILQLQQFLYVLPINTKINMNDLETKPPLSDSHHSLSTYRQSNNWKGGSLIVIQARSTR